MPSSFIQSSIYRVLTMTQALFQAMAVNKQAKEINYCICATYILAVINLYLLS